MGGSTRAFHNLLHALFVIIWVAGVSGHNRSQPSSTGVVGDPPLFHLPHLVSRPTRGIHSSPLESTTPSELYNPSAAGTILMYHQDSEILVERGTSHPPSRPAILSCTQQHSPQYPLFGHCEDDATPFSNMARLNSAPQITKPPTPSPRSSMDYVSASPTSSYAQSTLSSNFTLSTDGSSASSALFDGKPRSETTGTVLSAQLKRPLCHFIKRYVPGLPGSTSRAHIFPQHDNTTTLHYCLRVYSCALVTICSAAPFLPGIPRVRSLHLTPRDAFHQHQTRRFPAHTLEAFGTASDRRHQGERLDDDCSG